VCCNKLGRSDDFVPLFADTKAPQQRAHWKFKKYLLNEVSWDAIYDAFLFSWMLRGDILRIHKHDKATKLSNQILLQKYISPNNNRAPYKGS
jgi:hypothetical protein